MRKKNTPDPIPEAPTATAEQLQKVVQAAKTLAAIPDQKLLENPALNPATRARYDELTAARLQQELDLDHQRKLLLAQERVRRETEKAKIDQVIDAAREATDPAKTVLDMTRHQAVFGKVVLAASLALSVGSAMGMEALVQMAQGPTGVGYLAEIGLTGLSTTVIIWRGILARAGARVEPATLRLFAVLVVLPLMVSIVGSTIGSGPVGAACSVGSALFAGLAYLIATTASSAIGQSIAKIDAREQAHARPTTAPAPAATPGDPPLRGSVRGDGTPDGTAGIGDQTAAWLAEITRANEPRRQEASEPSATPGDSDRHPLADEAATPGEQELYPELEGTRREVMLAIHEHGVTVSNRALAKAVGRSRDTIRTHRTALWSEGYEVFPADHEVAADDQ